MARGDVKIITKGDEARRKLLNGAYQLYEAVAATYSPVSGNVGIQKSYGGANVTHDGVSVAREVYLKDEVEDMGAGFLSEASDKTNRIAGDGTSATVILGYKIHEKAYQRISAGFNPMKLRRGINKAAQEIKSSLEAMSIPVSDKNELIDVATISASDPEVGKLVADTISKVGGVGITVEGYAGLGIVQDLVDGVYFEKGWTMPHFVTDRTSEEVVHENVSIILVENHIKQNQDIVPIIEEVYKNTEYRTMLIIGNVSGQALETCALTNLAGKVKICVVSTPVYGDQELPFLEDIAILTGGKVIPKSLPASKITVDYFGNVGKIIVTKTATTLFDVKGNAEDIEARISLIKEQLQSDKFSAFQKERMEMRLAKLQGKIGIIKVGGTTETEVKELKDRVDDAIHATKSAQEEGILPGGATSLARLHYDADKTINLPTDEAEGYRIVYESLVEPFKRLMLNTGEDGGYRLSQLLKSKAGMGFNVENMTDEPINLFKAGVIDPTKVLKAVVENACGYAGLIITMPLTITYDRNYQLEQVAITKAHQ